MSTWPRSLDEEPAMRQLLISLDVITPRERRDLANSLLRAASNAALKETRILLLDLMLEIDDTIGGAE